MRRVLYSRGSEVSEEGFLGRVTRGVGVRRVAPGHGAMLEAVLRGMSLRSEGS